MEEITEEFEDCPPRADSLINSILIIKPNCILINRANGSGYCTFSENMD